MEGQVFVISWEDLLDQVCSFFCSTICYVFVQNALNGGRENSKDSKGFSLGVGIKKKEDSLGLLEKGL